MAERSAAVRNAGMTMEPRDIVLHGLASGSVALDRVIDGPNLRPYTSFFAPLAFSGALGLLGESGVVPERALIAEASVRQLQPLVPGEALTLSQTVVGTWDLTAYALLRVHSVFHRDVLLAGPQPVGEVTFDVYVHGAGGFGGPRPPREPRRLEPKRPPDLTAPLRVAENAALLYRLLGDLNPLHYDPLAAAAWPALTGGRPILHGLAGLGLVERLLVEHFGPISVIHARFAKPIWPGDTLMLDAWREGRHLQLRLRNGETNLWTGATAEVPWG